LAIALNYCWLEVEYFFQEKERVDKYSTTLHSVVGQAASCFDLSQLTYHQVFEYKHYLWSVPICGSCHELTLKADFWEGALP